LFEVKKLPERETLFETKNSKLAKPKAPKSSSLLVVVGYGETAIERIISPFWFWANAVKQKRNVNRIISSFFMIKFLMKIIKIINHKKSLSQNERLLKIKFINTIRPMPLHHQQFQGFR
jgi:hypothetical protein